MGQKLQCSFSRFLVFFTFLKYSCNVTVFISYAFLFSYLTLTNEAVYFSSRESHYLKWLALRLTNSWQRWAFIKKRIPKTKCQRSSASLQRKTVPLKANPPARPLRMILTNQRPIPSTQICNPLCKRDGVGHQRCEIYLIYNYRENQNWARRALSKV